MFQIAQAVLHRRQTGLHRDELSAQCQTMAPPSRPITLTAEQVDELNQKLSSLRHDINNHLSLMIAAIELIRTKPQMAERMMCTLVEQPSKIAVALGKFSTEFERTFGVARSKLA
jgi:cob(I)alamin adenosyltransferase